MFKSLYKINIHTLDLNNKSLRLKLGIEDKVNKAIFDCYYYKEGDFRKFNKELTLIKDRFLLTYDLTFSEKQIMNIFIKDIQLFQNYFKELEKISKTFALEINLTFTKKISPTSNDLNRFSYFKKSNLNNRG